MDCSDAPLMTESEGLDVEDRISRLPVGVICHILSFVPTKFSIRTSVLSKCWENLWALAPKIELDVFLFSNKEAPDRPMELCSTFTHSVDNLFSSRGSMPIDTFKLHFHGSVFPPRWRPSLWICAVIRCNVRELDLEIGYTESDLGALPCCLFTCKTLITLKLSGRFVLNVPYHVCLPNLKTLLLDTIIYLDDASFQKFLSGCPTLEDLKIIIRDWDPVVLNIGISSLKRLSLYSDREGDRTVRDDDQYKIVVDAPNLEFIDLMNWSDDVFLKPLPNIVEAQVDIVALQNRYKVIKLLRSMVNVTRLFLFEDTLESLGFTNPRALPTFCKLIHLELDNSYLHQVRLMDLLSSSPKLEALSLPWGIHIYEGDGDFDSEFPDHVPEQVPECLHCSLKTVHIKSFSGETVELYLVEYLLENSMVLEKMTLFCRHKPSSVEFVELKAKLTNFAKLSTNCQLDLLYQYRI